MQHPDTPRIRRALIVLCAAVALLVYACAERIG